MGPKPLELGHDGWYLCQSIDRPEFKYKEFKGGEAAALKWLRQFQRDTAAMAKLREWAGNQPGTQIGDDELLRRIAWQICTGRLKALQRTHQSGGGRRPEPPALAEPPAFPLEERRASSAPRVPEAAPDPPLFPEEAHLIAIAENLTKASRKGIPICVECEKAGLDDRTHVFEPVK